MGRYTADPSITPSERFTPNGEPANAVKVTVQKSGSLFFAGSFMDKPMVSASGIAYSSSAATFSIGSRLASLDGGLLNGLLNALLGTNVSLSVMDYRALVDARIDVLSFLDGLATELDLTAATYDDVLDTTVTVGQIIEVMADITGSGDLTASAALKKILNGNPSAKLTIPLRSIIEVGTLGAVRVGTKPSGMTAMFDAMQMLTASAALANGEHQVAVSLGVNVPGLASVGVHLAIGEPEQKTPFMTIGERGEIVHTAQTRLLIEAKVGGEGLLAGVTIRLPIYVELAYADARLTSISCPSGTPDNAKVTVSAKPGVAQLWIANVPAANLANFVSSPVNGSATVVNALGIKVNASAHVAATNVKATDLSFSHNDIKNLTVKSVSTGNLLETAVSSLLGELDLSVELGPLNLGLGGTITALLGKTLSAVAAPLDSLVYNLLLALGIKIGEVDVRVHGVACQRAVLVQ
ncbi:Uncharacterized membrane protein [Mesorhizobium australicum]|uniref:Uncharacterized membrane protein n=1 Tax=Mesorhizobium australicum TaxID=536018 RepID=A0A1X7PGZ6_9HYPH|nr:Uncharacterized membrane protein [Mesorhizobium australicum]